MTIQIIMKVGDLRLLETPETTERPTAVLIRVDHRETIECMAVVRTTLVGRTNHGIKISDVETSGEEDHETAHETAHVGVRSMITKAMVEEVTGEIVPTMGWIVEEEAIGILTTIGLELETKAIDVVVKDVRSLTIVEKETAIGREEIIII
jgi:hypothetical protein